MADTTKYFYMKLKEGFFEDDTIKMIEAQKDGYLYSNILLKMYLKSLKEGGKLMLNGCIPYDANMIATVTGHQVGTVEKALKLFKTLGLIDVLSSGAIYMLNIQNFIGKSSDEADRKRKYRNKINAEKQGLLEDKQDISPDILGTNVGQMSDKRDRELEIELELDKELELKTETETESESESETETHKQTAPASKKPEKHIHGEYKHVRLTDEELQKLESEFGAIETQEAITYLDEYIEMKGAKYKSHYLALRKWVFDAVKETKQRKERNQNAGSTKSQKLAQELEDDYQMLAQWANT
jgi:predicted phage replisome organizer